MRSGLDEAQVTLPPPHRQDAINYECPRQPSTVRRIRQLVQHPFCKFFACWFCVAVLAGAMRARSARSAEDGTAARRND